MALSKDSVNLLGVALLSCLTKDGVPESYIFLAAQEIGMTLDESNAATALLIKGGLLERAPGPRILPGINFEAVKQAYLDSKAARAKVAR